MQKRSREEREEDGRAGVRGVERGF